MKNEKFDSMYDELKRNVEFDSETKEIWIELLKQCVSYIQYRALWEIWNRDEKVENDSLRTACHNSVITHFNMLSRYLSSKNVIHHWKEQLGTDRKDIGDFSNYIVYKEAILHK